MLAFSDTMFALSCTADLSLPSQACSFSLQATSDYSLKGWGKYCYKHMHETSADIAAAIASCLAKLLL